MAAPAPAPDQHTAGSDTFGPAATPAPSPTETLLVLPESGTDPSLTALHLPVTPQMTARARHVASTLARPADEDAVWRLELLVSELVGNVLRHAPGASEVVVRLERHSGRLRVAVSDDGPGGEVSPQGARPMDGSGRGLALVGQLARSWGTEPREQGTCVWFEIDLRDHDRDGGTDGSD